MRGSTPVVRKRRSLDWVFLLLVIVFASANIVAFPAEADDVRRDEAQPTIRPMPQTRPPPSGTSGVRKYELQKLDLIQKLVDVLVQHRACSDRNDCGKQQLLFVSPEPWGLDVTVYGIQDQSILADVVNQCAASFFANGQTMEIRIKILHFTKKYDLETPFWSKSRPTKITFERRP